MAELIAKGVFRFGGDIRAESWASAAGGTEGQGPLGDCFDELHPDPRLGCESWEKAESELQRRTLRLALDKAGIAPEDMGLICAGDLSAQCTVSTEAHQELGVPYLGLYGACSTMAEALLAAALSVDSGISVRSAAVTSSHFSTAERQFRQPLSYGGQRTPTSQRTCTAAGAAVISHTGRINVAGGCIGAVTDMGIKDITNMGAAMAPAAADTLLRWFTATGTRPADYSFIVTGDLGKVGSALLPQLLEREGIDPGSGHRDCGVMIYGADEDDPLDTHCGGSGCGCGASVLCGHFLPLLRDGMAEDILFVATGALMSPLSLQQGGSIPAIAHLVHFRRVRT